MTGRGVVTRRDRRSYGLKDNLIDCPKATWCLNENPVQARWLMVGRDVRQGKVLIAFDGSQGSLKGVDWVGAVFGPSGYDISLTNVMRTKKRTGSPNRNGLLPRPLNGPWTA
jgi:hypothetical protein